MENRFSHSSLTRAIEAVKADAVEFEVFEAEEIDRNRPTSAPGNYAITSFHQKASSKMDDVWVIFKEHSIVSNFTGVVRTLTSQEIILCSEEPCFKKSCFAPKSPAILESGLTFARIKINLDKEDEIVGVETGLSHNKIVDHKLTMFCLGMIQLFSEDVQKAISEKYIS